MSNIGNRLNIIVVQEVKFPTTDESFLCFFAVCDEATSFYFFAIATKHCNNIYVYTLVNHGFLNIVQLYCIFVL